MLEASTACNVDAFCPKDATSFFQTYNIYLFLYQHGYQ